MSQLSSHDKAVLNCLFNPNLPLDQAYNEDLNENIKDEEPNTPDVIKSKELEAHGIKLAEASKFEEALTTLSEAIRTSPQRASIYNNRAQVHQFMRNSTRAFDDLTMAIDLGSKNSQKRTLCQAYCQRGLLYRKDEKIELAKEDFEKAASLGSLFAKNQLIELNPYAALCNQMLRKAFENLK
ncbi:tetratricopeptide repeat protein 36 homolog [Photinus pyralis]|nr:tetratricopeptide repeat protein 36 homolog [Photinus pyralis]